MPKKILITGCTSGIGKYLSIRLSQNGHQIIGLGKPGFSELDQSLVVNLVSYHQVDLSNYQQVEQFCTKIAKHEIEVDVLINNAGLKNFGELTSFDDAKITETFTVNLVAPILLVKSFITSKNTHSQFDVINISSNAALKGYGGGTVYCSSKAGLLSFGESLAEDLHGRNISVCTICPSTVKTQEYLLEHSEDRSKHLVEPEEIYFAILKHFERKGNKTILLTPYKTKIKYLMRYLRRSMNLLLNLNEV